MGARQGTTAAADRGRGEATTAARSPRARRKPRTQPTKFMGKNDKQLMHSWGRMLVLRQGVMGVQQELQGQARLWRLIRPAQACWLLRVRAGKGGALEKNEAKGCKTIKHHGSTAAEAAAAVQSAQVTREGRDAAAAGTVFADGGSTSHAQRADWARGFDMDVP